MSVDERIEMTKKFKFGDKVRAKRTRLIVLGTPIVGEIKCVDVLGLICWIAEEKLLEGAIDLTEKLTREECEERMKRIVDEWKALNDNTIEIWKKALADERKKTTEEIFKEIAKIILGRTYELKEISNKLGEAMNIVEAHPEEEKTRKLRIFIEKTVSVVNEHKKFIENLEELKKKFGEKQ